MFQNKTNIKIVRLMHFTFALDSSDIDLLYIDLLDTHLDMLDKNIPSKHYFFCLQDILKTSSRLVFKTSSRHAFKMSLRHIFKTSWRCLQCNIFSSTKTASRRLKASWKMSSRRLARCLQDVMKTSWETKNCYAEELLKTSWRHVLKTPSRRL